MPRPRHPLNNEAFLGRVFERLAAGEKLSAIAAENGIDRGTLSRWVHCGREGHVHQVERRLPDEAEVLARARAGRAALSSRDFQRLLMGDPPPGRSALDRRRPPRPRTFAVSLPRVPMLDRPMEAV